MKPLKNINSLQENTKYCYSGLYKIKEVSTNLFYPGFFIHLWRERSNLSTAENMYNNVFDIVKNMNSQYYYIVNYEETRI